MPQLVPRCMRHPVDNIVPRGQSIVPRGQRVPRGQSKRHWCSRICMLPLFLKRTRGRSHSGDNKVLLCRCSLNIYRIISARRILKMARNCNPFQISNFDSITNWLQALLCTLPNLIFRISSLPNIIFFLRLSSARFRFSSFLPVCSGLPADPIGAS